jgi:hypothetical protein
MDEAILTKIMPNGVDATHRQVVIYAWPRDKYPNVDDGVRLVLADKDELEKIEKKLALLIMTHWNDCFLAKRKRDGDIIHGVWKTYEGALFEGIVVGGPPFEKHISTKPCPECGGKGYIELFISRKPCEACAQR